MKFYKPLILLTVILFSGCSWYNLDNQDNVVARVNDVYLSSSEIKAELGTNYSKLDSTAITQRFINNWAKEQLLVKGAELNLNESKISEIESMVNRYKIDLLSNAYLEALVNKSLDTVVTLNEAKKYYDTNVESFNLNESLTQLRYIRVNEDQNNSSELAMRLNRYNQEDIKVLDSLKIQFKAYTLNDSTWIRSNEVFDKIPVLKKQNGLRVLKNSNFVQLKDSINLYLVYVKKVLNRGDKAPLTYVRPTLNQIVINKRKLKILKEIEKDITKDAIKNKQFEIYN